MMRMLHMHALVAGWLLCTIAAWAQDLSALRTDLRQQTGQAYEQARAQALALPVEDLDALLAPWERMEPDTIERLLADAIRIRRQQPERAVAFEKELRQALENPEVVPYRGGPRNIYHFNPDAADSALVCEVMFKRRNIPSDAYRSVMVLKPTESPQALDHLLALVRAREPGDVLPGVSHNAVRRTSSLLLTSVNWQADDATRNKIIAPVVEWYKRERVANAEQFSKYGGFQYYVFATVVLRQIGTPESLLALSDLIEWEREVNMPDQGLAPWADPSAREDYSALLNRDSELKGLIAVRRRNMQDFSDLEQEREAIAKQLPTIYKRTNAHFLWNQLRWMRDTVAAELAGDPLPRMTDY